MNHEAKKIMLRTLTLQVLEESTKLHAGASVKTTSSKHGEIMAKVERWQKQLEMIQRDLRSSEGFLTLRFGNPRKLGYSERQSMRSHKANIEGLREQAVALAQAIADLMGALVGPDLAWEQFAKALEKLVEGGDDLGLSSFDSQEFTATIRQLDPDSGGAPGYTPAPTMITDIITLCLAMYVILTRKKD
ncbi:MAG: hypothetical protein JXQ91_13955 [Vannielia sp.]|uniref:hypothetical protein n=1 Tax=Rhodobacterales TaxID=204455 RepID=UPI002094DB85|nr:hypothetical protein [Oceanicola sp. 502str15]MCO6382989.1 hypothetical protein [Oceanicola sp. 502str15]